MSYCRFSAVSSVYVYPSENEDGEIIVCCACSLNAGRSFVCPSATEMLFHLSEHQAKGETVPRAAIERLRTEAAVSRDTSIGAP